MAKLIINPQTPSRKEIDLPRSDLSIGRDPGNDVVIPDALVSRRHARLVFDGREYLFHDCESSNGSLLNGDRVSERKLTDGDVLWLGASRLLFRAPEAPTEANLAKVIQHPSSRKMRCPACEHPFQAGDVFCRQCGGAIEREQAVSQCPSCQARVLGPARFCNSCGDSLTPEARPGPAPEQEMNAPGRTSSHAPANSGLQPRVTSGGNLPAASAEKRLLAALVDFLATGALFALFSLPPLGIYLSSESRGGIAAWMMLLPVLSFPVYFIGFWATRGATPGKELLGLTIVMKNDAKPFGLRQCVSRFVGFCGTLITLGLGFMMILVDGDTLHDQFAGTRVVER